MSENNDALAHVAALLEQEEAEWAPTEPGETIVGHCREIGSIETKNGAVPYIKVEDSDGALWMVWCGRASLKSQLDRSKLQPGDALGIRYNGFQEGRAGGHSFHSYKVGVKPIGPRRPADAFKAEPDLGLTPAAYGQGDVWASAPESDGNPPY